MLGADPADHRAGRGPYDVDTTFHEPFVLFGYLAAITSLELVTGIIILPQRQTALVAKQAAEVDLLTEGRFRLGVGIGLERGRVRGPRQGLHRPRHAASTEQVELLRRLWTEPSRHLRRARTSTVTAAGLAPLPVQRPIPIWFGGESPPAYRRAGRLADGWFPQCRPGPRLEEVTALVREGAEAAGRDPDRLGMEGRVGLSRGVDDAAEQIAGWREAGASHVSVSTMGMAPPGGGPVGLDRHIAALAEVADAIGLPRRGV